MSLQRGELPRIAIYARVSTDEQAREGISLDEQRTRLLAYCRAMGWTAEVVEYVDDGYSAKNMDRPALQRLLREVKDGTITKLMVTKLDRLSRRLLDLLNLIEIFHRSHVSFISTTESFDTDTPSGRLTLQVLGAVAEFERERIRERVFDNMRHAAKSGKWLTQHPYGYRLVEKELVVHEPEAEIVRRVFRQFLSDGLGYFTIAKTLNEAGIPSRHNRQWSIRAIKLMLTNPAYTGTLVWNRTDSSSSHRKTKDEEDWVVMPHAHPAIVDTATWEQVQQRIHSKPAPPPRAKTSPHLLAGILRCGKCGSSMSIGWSGYPKRHRVYRCSAYKNRGTCDSKPYGADELEQLFLDGLLHLGESVDTTIQHVTLGRVEQEQVSRIEQRIGSAKVRYARQVEAYTAGLIDLNQLAKEQAAMEKTIHELTAALSSIDTRVNYTQIEQELRERAFTGREAIAVLPVTEAKAKIRTLVARVVVHGPAALEIVLALT